MKTKITNYFQTSLLNSLITNQFRHYQTWAPNQKIVEGSKRVSSGNMYIAFNTGVTGNTAPLHTTGKFQDGTVSWFHVMSISDEFSLGSTLHLTLGDPQVWANGNVREIEDFTDEEIVENISAYLRLSAGDMQLGTKRIEWKTGDVYDMWPSHSSYVISNHNVYRVIDNNLGKPSTEVPTGTSTHNFETTDGYIWKFIGTIDPLLDAKYGNDYAFPVYSTAVVGTDTWATKQVAQDGAISGYEIMKVFGNFLNKTLQLTIIPISGGTGASARADIDVATGVLKRVVSVDSGKDYRAGKTFVLIKDAAEPGTDGVVTCEVNGAGHVENIAISNIGKNYTHATLEIIGDGTGAKATAQIVSGYITNVEITNQGSGYTWASVIVVPGANAAIAKAIMQPTGGHGADLTKELPSNHLLVAKKITALDTPFVEWDREYGQVCFVSGVGNKDRISGDSHTDKTLDKADVGKTRILYSTNIVPIKLTKTDDSVIKLSLEIV